MTVLDDAIELLKQSCIKPTLIQMNKIDADFLAIVKPSGITITEDGQVKYRGILIEIDADIPVNYFMVS